MSVSALSREVLKPEMHCLLVARLCFTVGVVYDETWLQSNRRQDPGWERVQWKHCALAAGKIRGFRRFPPRFQGLQRVGAVRSDALLRSLYIASPWIAEHPTQSKATCEHTQIDA